MTSPAWTAEGNQFFANFGARVATAGDVNGDGFSDVLVGISFLDNQAGWAFAYHGSPAGLATTATWSTHGAINLGSAGDVNGDGFGDVIVGDPGYNNGQPGEGRALVYHGSATGLAMTPAWTGESNQASASYGYSVATAGDVNADGFDDIIIGASEYDNSNQPNQGRAFVYHGSASGLATTAAWFAENGQQGSNFGWSVGTAGDVNGDGYADVIVGAYRWSNPEGWEGGAFVYHGSPAGLAANRAWAAESNQIGAELGQLGGDSRGCQRRRLCGRHRGQPPIRQRTEQ